MDLNRLHGSLNTLHNISRVSQRPVWAFMELLQRTRGNLERIGPASFISPQFLTSNVSAFPDGHVELPYSEEEELRHMALCPQNPTPQEVYDMHKSLGVYTKFHQSASSAMFSMLSALSAQQVNFAIVRTSLDEMWGRTRVWITRIGTEWVLGKTSSRNSTS